MTHLPVFSTLVTFIFAAAVLARWRHKKPPHLLLWGIGLIFYGIGTFTEAVMGFVFHPVLLKLWYLSGAMLTAAWLGQGTIYLLVRRRWIPHGLMVALSVASLLSFVLVFFSPVHEAAMTYDVRLPASLQYQDILIRSGLTIFLTIFLNIYGTVALVGGAIYSAFLFWRKRVLVNRMFGNLLIAGGALLPAMAGSMLKAGILDWLYLSELFGAILMYGGFLLATATQAAAGRLEAPASSA